mmetsp:Transcript_20077/g.28450  ORF Transcript_20077/g.28450 Transcript_20077/m.28450 type:complete len:712 (+) Transcript_20077:112-2247(+)
MGPTSAEDQKSLEEWRQKRLKRQRAREQQAQAEKEEKTQFGNDFDNTNNDTTPFISVAKRRRMEQEAILLSSIEDHGSQSKHHQQEEGSGAAAASSQRKLTAQRRKQLAALQEQNHSHPQSSQTTTNETNHNKNDVHDDQGKTDNSNKETTNESTTVQVESLLEQAAALQSSLTDEQRQQQQRKEEEARILKEASQVQTNALQAASELAKGVVYTESMPSSWTVPRYILEQGEEVWNKVRQEWHMEVEGIDIPPPLKRFRDMKFPLPIIERLNEMNVKRPTPIQMQGLPVALAGRDMVGIAFTGSGKTITFSLPLVLAALEEELRLPLVPGEGPVGIVLAPSRELARQTFDVVQGFCDRISSTKHNKDGSGGGFPNIRAQLMIGGESIKAQLEAVQTLGVHAIVATPGRLRDVLKRKAVNLFICRYICLDEADRMLDLGFDEEVGEIMNYFPHQRQTLLFSATFPKKFQDFARSTLVKPIVVNVGRAGAANLDVIQEVEYVKQEAKIVYLLHCLQKTAPPVIIFCERKGDVDDIHEYLLLKGVEAVSIHGGKDQEERNEAIDLYKKGTKDVLVATDVAAKGLDFADIQHVINFDMPGEIENYVHRIGRTGRCGKTGVATTFINKSCEETTLLDLKHLLREARQRIPPVLMMLDDPRDHAANGGGGAGGGCSFCGGLGHTIVDCPKIDKDARRVAGGHKDALATGDGYGGDW